MVSGAGCARCGQRCWVWSEVLGVVSGAGCGQRCWVWSEVLGVVRGARCGQRCWVWSVVLGVVSGARCGQRCSVWSAVLGVVSGARCVSPVRSVPSGNSSSCSGSLMWQKYCSMLVMWARSSSQRRRMKIKEAICMAQPAHRTRHARHARPGAVLLLMSVWTDRSRARP